LYSKEQAKKWEERNKEIDQEAAQRLAKEELNEQIDLEVASKMPKVQVLKLEMAESLIV